MNPDGRLRILMTTDGVGGVWTYSTALTKALAAQGCRVMLVVMGPRPASAALGEIRAYPGIAVEVTDFALEWMDPDGVDIARTTAGLQAIARRFCPDLVHINGFRDAAGPWRRPVLAVAHSCVRSWWRACRGEDPTEGRWWRYVENAAQGLATADRWVAPTRAFARTVEELYAPPGPGEVIWNGIADRPPESRKEPFILAAGRLWDEAKNAAALAAIARDLAWPVAFVGAASFVSPESGALKTPRCLGELPRRDLLDLMSRAAIYAAPARYEPFGLAILEAAAAGCALVLSDLPSLRELWDEAALFVDPTDRTELRGALRRVIADPALRASLQRAARARAERYSLADTVRAYRTIYDSLLRDRPIAAPRHEIAAQALR